MKRLIIGISGASGVIYGIRVLEVLRGVQHIETHVVLSPAARERARKAMEQFFTRPADGSRKASGGRDVP